MKEIMNEWRRFLNEDSSFFGEKFVEYKRLVEEGGDPLWSAYKVGLKEIGRGSTRIVFELPDNKDFVLKIINKEEISKTPGEDPNEEGIIDRHGFTIQHKRNANKWEADLKIQLQHPSLFPKSTEHADDYSWILIERVEPMTKEEFREQLGLPIDLPRMNMLMIIDLIIETKKNMDKEDHFTDEYRSLVAESEDDAVTTTALDDTIQDELVDDDSDKTQKLPSDHSMTQKKPTGKQKIKNRIKSILSNTQAVRILFLMAKHNIQSTEFKAGNMGISKLNGNRMVLLDTSLWD